MSLRTVLLEHCRALFLCAFNCFRRRRLRRNCEDHFLWMNRRGHWLDKSTKEIVGLYSGRRDFHSIRQGGKGKLGTGWRFSLFHRVRGRGKENVAKQFIGHIRQIWGRRPLAPTLLLIYSEGGLILPFNFNPLYPHYKSKLGQAVGQALLGGLRCRAGGGAAGGAEAVELAEAVVRLVWPFTQMAPVRWCW